jgi:hypothetical protein
MVTVLTGYRDKIWSRGEVAGIGVVLDIMPMA